MLDTSCVMQRCPDESVVHIHAYQCTLTGRFTPTPYSSRLTSTRTVSNQVIACITMVGGCLSKCCSSSVINLAIGWIIQSTTVHSCEKELDTPCMYIDISTSFEFMKPACLPYVCYIGIGFKPCVATLLWTGP